ncbi:MAG: hypothetical protein EOP06_14915 [Proteobacteria bacterium]|nr:MAG: hypothetical protein EOP06_14915 [Pseudomonadota bacterium]
MKKTTTSRIRTSKVTPEEVLNEYRQQFTQHGNDLDFLTQAMLLIEAGHYQESFEFSSRVQPSSPRVEETPDTVDKITAQSAFIAALERAKPLHEQAALEIEGKTESSITMNTYFSVLESLKSSPDW